jgi:hypothetical protein
MNAKTLPEPTAPLAPDSQRRLIAYTTAAGLGAFFAGQSAEAQVTESTAFAPYPHTILPGSGTGPYGFYHYFSVDGGNTHFDLTISDPLTSHPTKQFPSQVVDLIGYGAGDLVLTPTFSPADANGHTNNAYAVCFLGGTTINATTASAPWYEPRLGVSYFVPSPYGGFYNYVDNKYVTTGALGFQFIGSVDGQTHFGYLDVQVNTVRSGGVAIVQSVVVKDVHYNATPNAPITVPTTVAISAITVGADNAVTITFTSTDNADPSTFTLETSPALGAAASWTTDAGAAITQTQAANPGGGINQGTYEIVTTGTGASAQYFRIQH